jgi:aminoglycoside phosphotransferase (APT) family kinase protein
LINETAIKAYLLQQFNDIIHIDITRIGSGVQGSGFLIDMKTSQGIRSYVIKTLFPEGLGHDYPSDRAAVFLLDLDEYKNLPDHVKAVDVLSEMEDGSVKSIGGGKEYYLLMERAEGEDYFHDLKLFSKKNRLDTLDRKKITSMTSYLAGIHAVKKDSPALYRRKLRDTVGHGECLMGVFDTYPEGILSSDEMANIIKKSIDWIIKLKPKHERLSQIHGDFHPGNIWFAPSAPSLPGGEAGDVDFILLDRSRGPWGDPADDVTALTINYIFFSIINHGDVSGAYHEGLQLFFDEYIRESRDEEIAAVAAPFYAFRGAVVANPVFYPEVTAGQRKRIFRFVLNVLDDETFKVERVNDYLR